MRLKKNYEKRGKMKTSRSLKGKTGNHSAIGDCYKAAFRFMMDECSVHKNSKRYILVHAEVMGQRSLEGTTFGHAFVVKDNEMVIDKANGRNLEIPAVIYYAIGQIHNIGNEHRYTCEEAMKKAMETGTYGPWDLVTESGL